MRDVKRGQAQQPVYAAAIMSSRTLTRWVPCDPEQCGAGQADRRRSARDTCQDRRHTPAARRADAGVAADPGRLRVTTENATSEGSPHGPVCPHCREPLVRRGRPELTLEHEIRQPRWSGLFTDDERAKAARRLARAGTTPHRRRGWPRARRAPKRSGS
jgi:hypothetical protein